MGFKHIFRLSKVVGLGVGLGVLAVVGLNTFTPLARSEQAPITVVKASTAAPAPQASPTPIPVVTQPQPASLLAQASAKMGVDVSVTANTTTNNSTWTVIPATDPDLQKFLPMLTSEWSKYPSGFANKVKLNHIYLVKNLAVSGQARAAMPDPRTTNALYYDVDSGYVTSQNGTYMRRVIHHEFDHYFEYTLYGSFYRTDAAWGACNPADFSYGNGGASAYSDPEFANTIHPDQGFVTGYAESGQEEDHAELFAWRMTNPAEVNTWAKTDADLQCKITAYQPTLTALSL